MPDPFEEAQQPIEAQPLIEDPVIDPQPEAPAISTYKLPADISVKNPVHLTNPKNGKSYSVTKAEKAQLLLDGGWQPESKEQLLDRVAGAVVKDSPIAGRAAAFTGQFLNQASFGVSRPIEEAIGGEQSEALNKALGEEYPAFNIAGGIAGFGLMITGKAVAKTLGYVGEGAINAVQKVASLAGAPAAKVAAGKITEAAVKLGAENVALNIPRRITEEALGDPSIASEGIFAHAGNLVEGAVEDAALGAGFGVGTSLLVPVLKSTSKVAGKMIPSSTPEMLQQQAKEFQFKNAGALTAQYKQLKEVTGKLTRPEQIQGVTDLLDEHAGAIAQFFGPNAINKKLWRAKEKVGATLNRLRATVDNIEPQGAVEYKSVKEGLDQLELEYSKGISEATRVPIDYILPGAAEEAFRKYGNDTSKWPQYAEGAPINNPRVTPDLNAIKFVKQSLESEALIKLQNNGMSKADAAAAIAEGKYPKFTLEEMHNFRQSTKEKLFNVEKANGIKTDGGTDAFNLVRESMDNALMRVGEKNAGTEFNTTFKETNKRYQELHNLIKYITEPAARAASARNKIGLTSGIAALAGPVEFTLAMAKQYLGNYALYQTLGSASKALDGLSTNISKSIGALNGGNISSGKLPLGAVTLWSNYSGEKKPDPIKVFNQIQKDLDNAQASPQALAQSLSDQIPGMDQYAPKNAAMIAATAQTAIKYLKEMAPKPPDPIYPGGPTRPWKPSDNELSKYARRFNAAMNPTSILDEIKTGTLSKESVEAVKTIYPNLYSAIQTELKKKLATATPSDVYKMRSKLRLILEDTEDPVKSAARRQGLQAGFAPNNTKVQPRANSKIDESGRYETPLSRISR